MRDIIDSYSIYPNDEKELQDKLEELFEEYFISYEREKRLSARDIPDFLINGNIVAEVKMHGGISDIHRQLLRYAQFDQVKELILISTKNISLPPFINNKPVHKIIIYTFL